MKKSKLLSAQTQMCEKDFGLLEDGADGAARPVSNQRLDS